MRNLLGCRWTRWWDRVLEWKERKRKRWGVIEVDIV